MLQELHNQGWTIGRWDEEHPLQIKKVKGTELAFLANIPSDQLPEFEEVVMVHNLALNPRDSSLMLDVVVPQ